MLGEIGFALGLGSSLFGYSSQKKAIQKQNAVNAVLQKKARYETLRQYRLNTLRTQAQRITEQMNDAQAARQMESELAFAIGVGTTAAARSNLSGTTANEAQGDARRRMGQTLALQAQMNKLRGAAFIRSNQTMVSQTNQAILSGITPPDPEPSFVGALLGGLGTGLSLYAAGSSTSKKG